LHVALKLDSLDPQLLKLDSLEVLVPENPVLVEVFRGNIQYRVDHKVGQFFFFKESKFSNCASILRY
jgi:hypothetical protein